MTNFIVKMALTIFVASTTLLGTIHAQTIRNYVDDLDRQVNIPTQPKKIASLHDSVLTIPLIELGIFPVGSHGRTTKEGVPFIRGSKGLTGYDFNNSETEFLGNLPVDIEKVASVKPDLIITTPWQKASLEQLEAIAPTVVVDYAKHSRFEIFDILAEITGKQNQLKILKGRYKQQIERIKRIVDTEKITVNVMQAHNGKILVWNTYFNLGTVLRDSGFQFPEIVNNIKHGKREAFSAESLQELDADYIFVTYRTDQLHTPNDAVEAFETVLPSFCDFLKACRENRMLVIPREEASANSFNALGITAYNVLTHISGHPYRKM